MRRKRSFPEPASPAARHDDMLTPRDAIDGRGRKIEHCAPYACGLEAKSVENGPGHGTKRPIGELIEGPARTDVLEGTGQDRRHLARRHRQERQTADDGPYRLFGEEIQMSELRRVHGQDSGVRKAVLQHGNEVPAVFDERQIMLADATREQRPREKRCLIAILPQLPKLYVAPMSEQV